MAKKGQATFCKKSVLVAVYVETPRKRRALLTSSNHHHHHHHHLHLHPANKHGGGGRNRRAELLNYAHQLRASATTSHNHQNKPLISYIPQPMNQITDVRSQPKHAKGSSTRGGSWKLMIPRFLRSLTMSTGKKKKKKSSNSSTGSITTSQKAKAIVQSFQAQKKKGIVAKFLAAFQKYSEFLTFTFKTFSSKIDTIVVTI